MFTTATSWVFPSPPISYVVKSSRCIQPNPIIVNGDEYLSEVLGDEDLMYDVVKKQVMMLQMVRDFLQINFYIIANKSSNGQRPKSVGANTKVCFHFKWTWCDKQLYSSSIMIIVGQLRVSPIQKIFLMIFELLCLPIRNALSLSSILGREFILSKHSHVGYHCTIVTEIESWT